MGSFQGHGLVSIFGELLNALWIIPALFLAKRHWLPKIGKGMKIWDYFGLYAGLLFIPNSAYCIFEIRHILSIVPNLWSYVVFGGISIVGVLTTVYGIRIIVNYYAQSNRERLLYRAILSLVCGLGAVAGLLDFASLPVIFFPPALIQVFLGLASRPDLLVQAALCAIFLFTSSLVFDTIFPNFAP